MTLNFYIHFSLRYNYILTLCVCILYSRRLLTFALIVYDVVNIFSIDCCLCSAFACSPTSLPSTPLHFMDEVILRAIIISAPYPQNPATLVGYCCSCHLVSELSWRQDLSYNCAIIINFIFMRLLADMLSVGCVGSGRKIEMFVCWHLHPRKATYMHSANTQTLKGVARQRVNVNSSNERQSNFDTNTIVLMYFRRIYACGMQHIYSLEHIEVVKQLVTANISKQFAKLRTNLRNDRKVFSPQATGFFGRAGSSEVQQLNALFAKLLKLLSVWKVFV